MMRLSRVVAAIAAWFGRCRKANAVSRHLSGPEVVDLRAQMHAHGVPDEDEDESRDEVKESYREK